jgi:DNA-binding Lrp family transcriptional regulator
MKETARHEDRRMTVKETADVLGVSVETVRANGKALFPNLFVNGKTTYLNEEQVTAIKLRIQGHHNLQNTLEVKNAATDLEKELVIQQALVYQQEKIERLRQAADMERTLRLKAETALREAERRLGSEVIAHDRTRSGLSMYQRIAEAAGLVKTDREDLLDTYQRRKR